MCLEIPGKIIEIKKDIANIDFGSEKRKAKIIDGNYKKGDFVLVQNGIVIESVPVEQVEKWLESLKKGLGEDDGS